MQPLQTPQTLWPPPHPLIFIFLLLLTPRALVSHGCAIFLCYLVGQPTTRALTKLVKVVSPCTLPTALGQVLLNVYFIWEQTKSKKSFQKIPASRSSQAATNPRVKFFASKQVFGWRENSAWNGRSTFMCRWKAHYIALNADEYVFQWYMCSTVQLIQKSL